MDVFTTAKLCLPDKLKEIRKPKAVVGTFADGRLQFERQTNSNHTLSDLSKVYWLRCVVTLPKTWPGLNPLKVDAIKEQDVRDWAAHYAEKYSPQFFNNALNVLRQIFSSQVYEEARRLFIESVPAMPPHVGRKQIEQDTRDIRRTAQTVRGSSTNAVVKPYPLDYCLVSGDKTGGDVGKPIITVYKGQEIKFCCSDCPKDFKKNPDKYMKLLDEAEKKIAIDK